MLTAAATGTAEPSVEVVWAPQPGSQHFFLTCPFFEVLYDGTRGPGKTDALLMDFAQHVGRGFGSAWRGVLFRRTYKQLDDVVAKSHKWFPRIFPDAKWRGDDYRWTFPDGSVLLFRHMARPTDYWNYHGHEYPWVGWEELTDWPTAECYDSMKACCRSPHPTVPRKYRATTNPYGRGHNWVKRRFVDPAPACAPINDGDGRTRVRLFGTLWENRRLLDSDPDYVRNLMAITEENKRRAWLEGSWDIVAGGLFDDVWRPERHVLPPFQVPNGWTWRRSFDWGSARPASLGIWAVSDGSEVPSLPGRRFPRGSLVRIEEWYVAKRGANGEVIPNEGAGLDNAALGAGIARLSQGRRFVGCVADPSIFKTEGGPSIYDQIRDGARREGHALTFLRADNARVPGWQQTRRLLAEAARNVPEKPGLWVCDTCRDFLRTVPVLPRDERNPDDADTEAEDHVADDVRYCAMTAPSGPRVSVIDNAF
jgi:hypothetical protein